jgi:hypothetical protein
VTEEIPAAPGWLDERLDEAFAGIAAADDDRVGAARDQYARCVAGVKQPAAPSDLLGAECERCRRALLAALAGVGIGWDALGQLGQRLEAIEAELAADS